MFWSDHCPPMVIALIQQQHESPVRDAMKETYSVQTIQL